MADYPAADGPPPHMKQVGRLALRCEGDLWVAYYAKNETMVDAVYLGSILIALALGNPDRKQAFIDLMTECLGDVLEATIGVRPQHFGSTPAPEIERGGHA